MSQLTTDLANIIGGPIIDKTGFTRTFDVDVAFSPDKALAGLRGAGTPPRPTDGGNRSIFAAIENQLGLKLELTKGSTQFLVIDSVERPSGN